MKKFIILLVIVFTGCATTQKQNVSKEKETLHIKETILNKSFNISGTATQDLFKPTLFIWDTIIRYDTIKTIFNTENKIQEVRFKTKTDTIIRTEYIKQKADSVYVEKTIKEVPRWSWWNLIYSIILSAILVIIIYMKIRK